MMLPKWQSNRPRWLPYEFDWAMGCSYRGMPTTAATVRNVWTGNMVIRRQAFTAIGGFRQGFGKVGHRSRPEDTDLCIRAKVFSGSGIWVYEPAAIAEHNIPADRNSVSYFLRRCYYEGQGKAALISFNGAGQSTSEERHYIRRVLPLGVVRGLRETLHGDVTGLARSLAIIVGLSVTSVGFIADRALGSITRLKQMINRGGHKAGGAMDHVVQQRRCCPGAERVLARGGEGEDRPQTDRLQATAGSYL